MPSAVKKDINRKVRKEGAKYAIKNNDYEQNRNQKNRTRLAWQIR